MRLLNISDLKRVTSDPEQAASTRFQNDLEAGRSRRPRTAREEREYRNDLAVFGRAEAQRLEQERQRRRRLGLATEAEIQLVARRTC